MEIFIRSSRNPIPPPRGGQGGASIGKIEQCLKYKVFLIYSKSYQNTV